MRDNSVNKEMKTANAIKKAVETVEKIKTELDNGEYINGKLARIVCLSCGISFSGLVETGVHEIKCV